MTNSKMKQQSSRAFQKFAWISFALVIIIYLLFGRQTEYVVEIEKVPEKPAAVASATVPAKDRFDVAAAGFWQGLGATKGHAFDPKLSQAIINFFKKEQASLILELGCGLGNYAKEMRASGLFVSCYDGNPDTQTLSEGRCGIIDLSKNVDFDVHDWVLSLEVGEHIPKQFEQTFLNNLHKHNAKGVLVSWAIEGQGGTSHVNNQNNTYVRNQMKERGYNSDFEAEKTLRGEATLGWFKNTIMVFKKQQ